MDVKLLVEHLDLKVYVICMKCLGLIEGRLYDRALHCLVLVILISCPLLIVLLLLGMMVSD